MVPHRSATKVQRYYKRSDVTKLQIFQNSNDSANTYDKLHLLDTSISKEYKVIIIAVLSSTNEICSTSGMSLIVSTQIYFKIRSNSFDVLISLSMMLLLTLEYLCLILYCTSK